MQGVDFPETNAFPLTSHFINGLLRRGYKVIAYTNSPVIDEPVVYETTQLKVCVARNKPQPGRRFFLFEVEDLQQLILRHPADFISAFWSYEYAWAALKTGIPTVVNLHDVASQILLNHRDMYRLVRWTINAIVVHKAKYLIANSEYTYNQLGKKLRSKTITINNFYPNNLERSLAAPVQKENYIVSVVQGFSRRKNIDTALKAFATIRERQPEVEYHLVGIDMEEGGLAHQYATTHNLAEGVKFLGPLPFNKVTEHIAKAKLLLHSSREESFGMVVLEAMVVGTPVVGGTESGFIPYLLNYGQAGLLTDINSSDAIASSVISLLKNETLQAKLKQDGYDFAVKNFSEQVVIDKHLAYYSKILGKQLQTRSLTSVHTSQE